MHKILFDLILHFTLINLRLSTFAQPNDLLAVDSSFQPHQSSCSPISAGICSRCEEISKYLEKSTIVTRILTRLHVLILVA